MLIVNNTAFLIGFSVPFEKGVGILSDLKCDPAIPMDLERGP